MERKRTTVGVRLTHVFYNKLAGLGCILASAVEIGLLHEATASVIFLPLGIYLLFTKEKCIG